MCGNGSLKGRDRERVPGSHPGIWDGVCEMRIIPMGRRFVGLSEKADDYVYDV